MAFAAIDTETSGLEPDDGAVLLQVAAYVTNDSYEPFETNGFEAVFSFTEAEVEAIRNTSIPFVQEMHEKTGLWARLTSSEAVSYEEGDAALANYLASFGEKPLYMLGNSITLDRNFMAKFLPKSFALLHYRSLDVTSVRLFMEEAIGVEEANYREENSEVVHEARADILASLEQVKKYKEMVLKNR